MVSPVSPCNHKFGGFQKKTFMNLMMKYSIFQNSCALQTCFLQVSAWNLKHHLSNDCLVKQPVFSDWESSRPIFKIARFQVPDMILWKSCIQIQPCMYFFAGRAAPKKWRWRIHMWHSGRTGMFIEIQAPKKVTLFNHSAVSICMVKKNRYQLVPCIELQKAPKG